MKGKVQKLKPAQIFEMHVELEGTEPRVWWRFLVRDSISMYQLHEILQVTMGWRHSHLFMFRTEELIIAEPSPDSDWGNFDFKDACKVKVSSVFKNTGDSITYEYDFGDSWEHNLRLERVVDRSEVMFDAPRCIAGKNACPPEDCGGFPGFERLKKVIANTENKEYENMIRWLDVFYPNYDPKEFSLGEVNKRLKIGASKYLKIAPKFYELLCSD